MRRVLVALSLFGLWLTGCGIAATVYTGAAVTAGGGSSSQSSKQNWTLTAASGITTTTTGTLATDDPEAPDVDTTDASIGCATVAYQTLNGTLFDNGCGALTVNVDPLLMSARVTGTIASRITDANGNDLGASSLAVDVTLTGAATADPQQDQTFTLPMPEPGNPDAAVELFARAALHRAATGTGSVVSERFGPVPAGPINGGHLYRDLLFSGAAMTCVQQSEACKPK